MGEPVPAVLDYYGCDKQSPDGSCVGLITPQVSCVRAPEDCDKRSLDGSRDAVGRRLVHLLMFHSVHGCMVYARGRWTAATESDMCSWKYFPP